MNQSKCMIVNARSISFLTILNFNKLLENGLMEGRLTVKVSNKIG